MGGSLRLGVGGYFAWIFGYTPLLGLNNANIQQFLFCYIYFFL